MGEPVLAIPPGAGLSADGLLAYCGSLSDLPGCLRSGRQYMDRVGRSDSVQLVLQCICNGFAAVVWQFEAAGCYAAVDYCGGFGNMSGVF